MTADAEPGMMPSADPRVLAELGLWPLWVRRERSVPPAAQSGEPATEMDQSQEAVRQENTQIASIGSPGRARSEQSWEVLAEAVSGCRACGLCETRRQTVFGIGARQPEWLFVGEAPGAEEDARGEPFVGQAGRLLDSMLAALNLSRERTVYIANVLKCRPPANRDPAPEEVARCSPYLMEQIAHLEPRVIVALGRFAAQTLTGSDASLTRLRGRVHSIEVHGRRYPLVATFHPSYLLRTPDDKRQAWVDLCLARTTWQDAAARA